MRLLTFALAIGVSLSTLAQNNPQPGIKQYRDPICRSPDLTINKFYAQGIDFRVLLEEQFNLASDESTDQALIGRLNCATEAFSSANKDSVPVRIGDKIVQLPTVPELLLNKMRVLNLNMIILESGTPTAESVSIAADMTLEVFGIAKFYLGRGSADYAKGGIEFARILHQSQKRTMDEKTKRLILNFLADSLLADLDADTSGPSFGAQTTSLRSLKNSPNIGTSIQSLEGQLENIIGTADQIRIGIGR